MPSGSSFVRTLGQFAVCGLLQLGLVPCAYSARAAGASLESFDTSAFIAGATSRSGGQQPKQMAGWNGRYLLDGFANQAAIGSVEVGLEGPNDDAVSICLTPPTIRMLGIKPSALRPAASAALIPLAATRQALAGADAQLLTDDACLQMEDIVPGGGAMFDGDALSVTFWFPQAYAVGALDADLRDAWADSATIGVLGYKLSTYDAIQSSVSSQYLGLNARLSAGNWGFEHRGAVSQVGGATTDYQTGSFNASTGIAALRSTVTLGSLYIGNGLFDGSAMEGVVLGTDTRMLPASQRTYAPTIRGEAIGNASVEVWQFGKLVHSMTVPPGPFVIDKLYALGFGGDLTVIVKEADGRQRTFTVPYAPPVDLLLEGSSRYSLAAGEVTKSTLAHPVMEGTFRYGLSSAQTVQAGVQWSDGYSQFLMGSSFSTALGAVGITMRRSELLLPMRDSLVGGRFDVNWVYASQGAQTRLNLVTSRYSSQNYYDLSSAMDLRNAALLGTSVWGSSPIQQSTSASISQTLSPTSSVYLSGIATTRWNRSYDSLSYQLGYSMNWRKASMNLSTTQYQYASGQTSSMVSFSVSIPLDFGKNNIFDTYTSLQQDQNGDVATSVGVSPRMASDSPWSYGVSVSDYKSNQVSSGNLSYRGAYANLSGTASGTNQSGLNQMSLGANGAVLAHSGGLSFAPSVGDTFAVVHVEGGEGVRVYGMSSVTVDSRGYAVVPYLIPYSANTLELDTSDVEPGLEFEQDSYTVVPRAGTGVMVRFAPRPGWPALIRAKLDDGRPLPFAAELRNGTDQLIGYVGQGGQVQAHLTATSGLLYASWGDGADKTCALPYRISETGPRPKGTMKLEGVCTVVAHMAPSKEPEEAKDTTPPTASGAAKVVSMNIAEASP